MNRLKKNFFNPKGQSLLEFAVSVAILLILLAGIVDLGRMIFYVLAMRDAAQEGVTYGVVNPAYCDQLESRILSVLPDPNTINVNVEIAGYDCRSVPSAQNCVGQEILVQVEQPSFPITMPLIGSFLGSQTIPLRAQVTGTIIRACH